MSSSDNKNPNKEFVANIERMARLLFGVVKEIYLGIRHGFIPWNGCFAIGSLACILFILKWDRAFWDWIYIGKFYPSSSYALIFYWGMLVTSSFWLWALVSYSKKQARARTLETVFCEAGLKSIQGRVPQLVFDKAASDHTHTLRVTVAGANLDKFKKAKTSLESNLLQLDPFRDYPNTLT